ncbi:endonuclease [Oxalobacteraceae bacterium OM1]|nr:endonuclease [Oxalobacteraceae bacterium OM1]
MKLITWNIQWGRGVDGRVDLERIVNDARRLADFDVLCLQEVADGFDELGGNDARDQFAEVARLLPGFTPVRGIATDIPGPDGRRKRFGNMVLSRFPVLQTFSHLLPWPADPGVKSMQRMALEASLQTPLGPIRVTTTHLEYYSAAQRRAQIERLRELQREAVAQSRNGPVADPDSGPFCVPPRAAPGILTGDFNCRPDSPEQARLVENIDKATPAYADAWQVRHPGETHAPTVGLYDKVQWPGESFTFDCIFVTADLVPRVRDVRVDSTSAASDHQPVLLELG